MATDKNVTTDMLFTINEGKIRLDTFTKKVPMSLDGECETMTAQISNILLFNWDQNTLKWKCDGLQVWPMRLLGRATL